LKVFLFCAPRQGVKGVGAGRLRQSRPDSGLGVDEQVLGTLESVLVSRATQEVKGVGAIIFPLKMESSLLTTYWSEFT